MTIGEVSKTYEISPDTLRYYEKIGLIDEVNKKSGIRDYKENDIERIKFILCMKNAGLCLEDIVKFISYYKKGNSTIQDRIDLLTRQKTLLAEEIESKKETMSFLDYKIDLYTKMKEENK